MNTPIIGEKYKHFKGNEYQIIAFAKHSETLEDLVVYKALYGEGQIWVRPLEMFCDMKTLEDGTQVQRFTKLG
jgi:cyclomaltodextrinase